MHKHGRTSKKAPKVFLIYVIGAPGAGKGTLCALIAKHFTNTHHLSVGDHLRSLIERKSQNAFGGLDAERLSKLLQLRSLLPPSAIVSIVHDAVNDVRRATRGNPGTPIVLVDGFPRDPESAPSA